MLSAPSLASTKRRLASLLTPATVSLLDSQGYAVIDEAFPSHIAHGLHSEILSCYDAGLMSSNHTAYVEASSDPAAPHISRLYSKPHIYEAEALPPLLTHPTLALPLLSSFTSDLIPHLDEVFASLLPSLLLYSGHSSLKIQLNSGGGCFPFHLDSPGDLKDTRRLTLLLYLNPDYTPSDGGSLLLQPFLAPPVSVHPVFNRCVLFYSHRLLHRVLPAKRRRCCLTVWLHGRSRDRKGEEGEWLLDEGVQRALSKCLYEAEWRDSYREAHDGEGGERLAGSLSEDVRRMMGDERVSRVVELMRDVKRSIDRQQRRELGQGQGDVTGEKEETGEDEETAEGGGEVREVDVRMKEVTTEELGFLDFL